MNFDFLRPILDFAMSSAGAWGSLAVIGLGLATHLIANRDAWPARKDARHHLHEVTADTLGDIQKTAVAINTEVWNQLEFPLTETNLRKEGETISLAAGTDLLILERQVGVTTAVVDELRDKGLTNQTFAEMMEPGSTITVTATSSPGRFSRHNLDQRGAALVTRSLEGVRDNVARVDQDLKDTYNILDLELNVSVQDALRTGKLPDFEQWVNEILKTYPKALEDIVRNNGAEAAQEVFKLLKEKGELALSGADRKELRENIGKLEKSDAVARGNRDLPKGYEEPPASVIQSRRKARLTSGRKRGHH